MQAKHWIVLIVIFIIGYFVGVKFPTTANKITGIVPSASM